jgi:hypothetical protein
LPYKKEGTEIVKTKVLNLAVALLVVTVCSTSSLAQRTRKAGAPAPTPPPASTPANAENRLLAALPNSDAMALVKVRQLLEGLPKILAENPAKLAEANAEIEKFKTKTGIDPRAFDQLALGMHYSYPREGITRVDTVGLARGSFNAAAFVAAGRIAASGKYRLEKYRGYTIYIFTLDQQIKIFGLLNTPIHDLAVTVLESNLLALGTPAMVRTVIDAPKARHAGQTELIALASQDPNALIGFGGNVTPALLRNLKVDNEAIAKEVSTIRQVYGTLGLTERDFEMFLAARTTDAASAKNLSDTLEFLRQLGAGFVGRLPAPRGSVARTALDNLKITTQGNELRIRTAVAQAQLGPLMRGM